MGNASTKSFRFCQIENFNFKLLKTVVSNSKEWEWVKFIIVPIRNKNKKLVDKFKRQLHVADEQRHELVNTNFLPILDSFDDS